MAEYMLCYHPNEESDEWLAVPTKPKPVYRFMARMSWGPFVARCAQHKERGPMNVAPDHDASAWLPARVWINADDCDDHTHYEDDDFIGWLVPEDIAQELCPGQFTPIAEIKDSPNQATSQERSDG